MVMLDTRLPSLGKIAHGSVSLKAVTANALTYFTNLKWVCQNGYDLLYYHLQGEGCLHPTWGARHPSYCKLAAVSHALSLERYRYVVFFDSDAFVRNTTMSVEMLLDTYGTKQHSGDSIEPCIFFGWDTPYSLGPNAGFFIVRDSPAARELLHVWWNLDHGPYGMAHSFEQNALQWMLLHVRRFRAHISTLRLRAINPLVPDAVRPAGVEPSCLLSQTTTIAETRPIRFASDWSSRP